MALAAQRHPMPTGSPQDEAPPPRRRRHRFRTVLLVLLLLLAVPTVSFVRALTYPGQAPVSVKAVEWVRDHGGGGIVDAVENWWYTRERPAQGSAPQDGLAVVPGLSQAPSGHPAAGPADLALPRVRLMSGPRLPGEGGWRVASRTGRGVGLLYRTMLRPDARYPSVIAAAALFPRDLVRIHLDPGTREPSPGAFTPAQSRVPAAQRRALVAVFNAGWKLKDTAGGWFAGGRTLAPLRPGLASLVIDAGGRARVETWTAASSVTGLSAVRQNLHLVIAGGRPVAGLSSNRGQLWGNSHNQYQYAWRSGVGTDRRGDLVYVAGRSLTLRSLAEAMSRVGIVTGMELDMHNHMVGLLSFGTPGATAHGGTRLLADMPIPDNRYLVPDQRDYLTVTAGG